MIRPSLPLPRRAWGALLLALALPGALRAQGVDTRAGTATVRGEIVGRESQLLLPFATVAIPALGRARFADADGRFVLAALPAGTHRLLVKRLGYTPREIDVTVRDDSVAVLRVELGRIAVRLDRVLVTATPECRSPGPPSAAADPDGAEVFAQLRENAERMRLLARAHPFVSVLARNFTTVYRDGTRRTRSDTLLEMISVDSAYHPGNVFWRDPDEGWKLRLPLLTDFSDPGFQRSHCFFYRGLESVGEERLVRVDVRADARLRAPDVDAVVYLDTASYLVRRYTLTPTRLPSALAGTRRMEVLATFTEAAPGLSILDLVLRRNVLRPLGRRPVTEELLSQELIQLRFVGDPPPGLKRPD